MTDTDIDDDWNTTRDKLQSISNRSLDFWRKNVAQSALDNGQTLRDCGRMIDGLNLMKESLRQIR